MVEALGRLPARGLHGDLKLANVALFEGATVGFIDWQMTLRAPVAVNGPLNGNLPANQSLRSGTLTNLNWQVGESLYLRFHDVNNSGNDAGLAVDSFQLNIPEPASVALMLLASLGCSGCLRRRNAR